MTDTTSFGHWGRLRGPLGFAALVLVIGHRARSLRMTSCHHGRHNSRRPTARRWRSFPMLERARSLRALGLQPKGCGASCPAGLSAFQKRAGEVKRRWCSDGLQVRPDGKSSGRRFQLENQPRFRRDWSIVRFGNVHCRGDWLFTRSDTRFSMPRRELLRWSSSDLRLAQSQHRAVQTCKSS